MYHQNSREPEPAGVGDYLLAIVGAGTVGGFLSFLIFCVVYQGIPHTGIWSSAWLTGVPGALIGAVLGLRFPRAFSDAGSMLIDHFLSLIFRR